MAAPGGAEAVGGRLARLWLFVHQRELGDDGGALRARRFSVSTDDLDTALLIVARTYGGRWGRSTCEL